MSADTSLNPTAEARGDQIGASAADAAPLNVSAIEGQEQRAPFSWKTVTATVIAIAAITVIVLQFMAMGDAGAAERVVSEALFLITALVGGFKVLDFMQKRSKT